MRPKTGISKSTFRTLIRQAPLVGGVWRGKPHLHARLKPAICRDKLAYMPHHKELPKAYEPHSYEDAILRRWEKSGYFNPDRLPQRYRRGKPFSMVLPPPNVTGTLHLGHATMLALQDLLIRWRRMQGRRALWVPGTDHAAIATQVKVEELLRKKGIKNPRQELGREKLIGEIEAFAAASHDTIVNQVKRMGASIDWSREAYTLDEARTQAVHATFKLMYDDGLIYRGDRVVNWCPRDQSTLSDDEVEHREQSGRLYYIRYRLEGKGEKSKNEIVVATTRPETKLGDTALAVHPRDLRYQNLVGKLFEVDLAGHRISVKVIADKVVDPAFGSGVVGVTPAHSMTDFELAQRHGLPLVQVIGEDGHTTSRAGTYAGQRIEDARRAFVRDLEAAGLMEKIENITHNVGVCYRCNGVVESIPKKQWWLSVHKPSKRLKGKTLAEAATKAVTSGKIKIVPERFKKIYLHWMRNLRDWNISRQIWFGHRIPVWYHEPKCIPKKGHEGDVVKCQELVVASEKPVCKFCDAAYVQDPDTLDTWFSSGLWTFSTLGWPKKTKDLSTYHPTDVLETGYDILFFWVARMVLMTTFALGDVPFRTVYLHGLVRDQNGRKMSKSLGNIIDPLDVSAKYGTDAVRLSMVLGTAPGQDTRLWEEKIAGFRNFTNKLWNIGRYVSKTSKLTAKSSKLSVADRWILSRLNAVTKKVTANLDKFNFSAAGELLRDFTWNEFADWYVEIHKRERNDAVLRDVYFTLLRLWHPFMPYVTEAIHHEMSVEAGSALGGKNDDLLMVAAWPKAKGKPDATAEKSIELLRAVVNAIRSIRADYRVDPKTLVDASIDAGPSVALFESFASVIKTLGRVHELHIAVKSSRPAQSASITIGRVTVSVPLIGLIDIEKEKKRIIDTIADTEKRMVVIEHKLKNREFVARAPAAVVEAERAKLEEARQKNQELNRQLTSLTSTS